MKTQQRQLVVDVVTGLILSGGMFCAVYAGLWLVRLDWP